MTTNFSKKYSLIMMYGILQKKSLGVLYTTPCTKKQGVTGTKKYDIRLTPIHIKISIKAKQRRLKTFSTIKSISNQSAFFVYRYFRRGGEGGRGAGGYQACRWNNKQGSDSHPHALKVERKCRMRHEVYCVMLTRIETHQIILYQVGR